MTDQELKILLAAMLPEKVYVHDNQVFWNQGQPYDEEVCLPVIETEWLHLCWLVEQTLSQQEHDTFRAWLCVTIGQKKVIHGEDNPNKIAAHNERKYISASWQQRGLALCKVRT